MPSGDIHAKIEIISLKVGKEWPLGGFLWLVLGSSLLVSLYVWIPSILEGESVDKEVLLC